MEVRVYTNQVRISVRVNKVVLALGVSGLSPVSLQGQLTFKGRTDSKVAHLDVLLLEGRDDKCLCLELVLACKAKPFQSLSQTYFY